LVERDLAKVEVAGSKPVSRSTFSLVALECAWEWTDIPSRIEVGGSVMPVLKGEPLRLLYALVVAASLTG
jgi:hypothetical protein